MHGVIKSVANMVTAHSSSERVKLNNLFKGQYSPEKCAYSLVRIYSKKIIKRCK